MTTIPIDLHREFRVVVLIGVAIFSVLFASFYRYPSSDR